MKKFLITIDTEGDNLWSWKIGDIIKTENSCYLQRFQELCNHYEFKPVWLTNYEMLNDDRYIQFIRSVVESRTGECGMHLHAWNTPPVIDLPVDESSGAPYLIEYSKEIMDQKINTMTNLIREKVGINPVSHRAGRWAINDDYFELLDRHGYTVDCTITPGLDWSRTRGQSPGFYGSDYSRELKNPHYVKSHIFEVPVSIEKVHRLFLPRGCASKDMMKSVYYFIKGKTLWLRPNGKNQNELLSLARINLKSNNDYLMFMLHSSELMPGGSPIFKDNESIEQLYSDLKVLFDELSKNYVGITLSDYANTFTLKEI